MAQVQLLLNPPEGADIHVVVAYKIAVASLAHRRGSSDLEHEWRRVAQTPIAFEHQRRLIGLDGPAGGGHATLFCSVTSLERLY